MRKLRPRLSQWHAESLIQPLHQYPALKISLQSCFCCITVLLLHDSSFTDNVFMIYVLFSSYIHFHQNLWVPFYLQDQGCRKESASCHWKTLHGWENNAMCFPPSALKRKYNCFVILKQSMREKNEMIGLVFQRLKLRFYR